MAPHHRKLATLEVKIIDLERKYEAIKKIIEDKFGAVVDVSLTSSSTETEEHDLSSTSSTTDDDITNVPSNDSESLIPTDDATDYDKVLDNKVDNLDEQEHEHQGPPVVDDQSKSMIKDCLKNKLVVKISRLPLPVINVGQGQDKSNAIVDDDGDDDDDDDGDIEFKLNSNGELKTYANLMVANKKRRLSPPYNPMAIVSIPEEENSNDVQIVAFVNGQTQNMIELPQNKATTDTDHSTIHKVNKQECKTDVAELVNTTNNTNRKVEISNKLKLETNEGKKPQTVSHFKEPTTTTPPTLQLQGESLEMIIMDEVIPLQNNIIIDNNEESDDETKQELFLCSYCNLDCVTKLGLGYHHALMHSARSHQRQNYANRNKIDNKCLLDFKCLDCHQICANKEELIKHGKIHNKNGKKKQIKKPSTTTTTKEKCPHCYKMIEKSNLPRHIKQVHANKNSSSTMTLAAMKAALATTTTLSPPSSVSSLNASTPSACEENLFDDLLAKHLCELCGVQFDKKIYLEAHVKSIHYHHEKKKPTFPCLESDCFSVFASKISLKNHSFTHLSEEEKAEYKLLNYAPCPICNKEYKKVSLKTHIKRHNSSASSSVASPNSSTSTYIPPSSTISSNNNNSQTIVESQNNLSLSLSSIGTGNCNNNNNNNLILFNDYNNERQSSIYSSTALVNSQQQVNNNINNMMMMNQQMISNNNNNNGNFIGVSSSQSQNSMNTPQSQSNVDQQFQLLPYRPVENFPSLDESFSGLTGLDLPMPLAEDYEIGDGLDIFQDIFTSITDDTFQDILSSVE